MLVEPSPAATSGALHAPQPGRLAAQPVHSDRVEAERAFALAEQLGSVNAAAAELGTTWLSLRKAFVRHGLGMHARNPEAVRQRAVAAAGAVARLPRRHWTRCSRPSTLASARPESGRRLSGMGGSAARSSTPPWAPVW
jgi:hypothetical protein